MKIRRRHKKPPTLMLTSLLDMFTIILIFLIVSFGAEDYDLKLQPGLTLPESSAHSVFKPAANVAVTKAGVFVQQEEIVSLTDGEADAAHHEAGEMPALVAALSKVLAARQNEAERTGESFEDADIVMLQADKDLEYRTLYLVMRSARIAGFTKYRLTTMRM